MSLHPDSTMPLEGLRVLELGELLAGPFIGTLLGEFGAEVIKIERPHRGDVLRQFGPVVSGQGLYWLANGRNKKSVALDLGAEAGRAVLEDLIARSDVLISSLRPGTVESWGFHEARMRRDYPELIVVYASAYGRFGPYRDKGGYDPVAQGFSGLSFITGEVDGPPMRAGGAIPVCDFMTGIAGALGAVLALYARKGDGAKRGQTVDIALYDMAFRMLAPLLSNYDLTGAVRQRDGNHSLGGAPTGHFQTKDGKWICTSVQNNEQFRRLARLLGHPEWVKDPRFATLKSRTEHRDVIECVFATWVAGRVRGEVIQLLDDVGLVVGPINSVADLAADPHVAERGSYWDEHPTLGRFRTSSVVPGLSRTPGQVRHRAPEVGEHTVAVLKNLLSYSEKKVADLSKQGVVQLGDHTPPSVHPSRPIWKGPDPSPTSIT